jgi:hypothetical protein
VEAALTEDLRLQDIGPLIPRVGKIIKDEFPNEYGANPAGECKTSHDAPLAVSAHERCETVFPGAEGTEAAHAPSGDPLTGGKGTRDNHP